MATIDSVSSWIPEDDLLLKNAVEAGASLEALAKGAVQFSRRLTVQELKNRWHSLLYDPKVSNQASGCMGEFELSSFHLPAKSSKAGNSKLSAQVLLKRKVDSVRKQYYAMRKRLRLEACNSDVVDFTTKPINDEAEFKTSKNFQLQQIRNEKMMPSQAFQDTNLSGADSIKAKHISDLDFLYSDLGHVCSGFVRTQCSNSPISDDDAAFHSMGFSSPVQQGPLWKMTEDVSAPHMPIHMNLTQKDHIVEEASLLPDNNEEGNLLFMDVDANTMDKSCDDNLNSLLLNSPNNSHEDDVSNATVPKMQVSSTDASQDGASPSGVDVIASQLQIDTGTKHDVCCLNVNVPSSSSVPDPYPYEAPTGIILCVLNTEDQEIPCIDLILPSKGVHDPDRHLMLDKDNDPAALYHNQKRGARELCLTNKKDKHTALFSASQMSGTKILSDTSLSQLLVGCGDHSKFPLSLLRGSRHANNSHVELGECGPAYLSANVAMSRAVEKGANRAKLKDLDAPATVGESELTGMTYIQSGLNPSTSDQEEVHSDDDLPSFSDVEAMILEMDLCQHEEDSFLSKEVSGYQHKEKKRQIIRLEQSAQSSLRRSIASKGALAILHGHHSRHYIKKAEVILGRATDDIDVDIDLATEGRANRISRRQASIKLEKDGSFFLKNLGKSLISVNGKDIATGQLLTLNSSCLIEIREIRFVFEVNHKSIRRFLAKTGGNCKDNNATFEWSQEGF